MRISDWSSDVCSSDLAGAGVDRVGERDDAPFRRARHRDRGVVLLRRVDPVGILVVDVDAVELGGVLVVDRRPALAAVERHAGRSEEHTSELQSLMRISYAVFCLKKKNSKTKRRQPIDKNTAILILRHTDKNT